MNKKFTIECIIDLEEDQEKAAAFEQLFRDTGVQVQAKALLIGGNQKPQTVVYADDFFHGRKDIDILAEKVVKQIESKPVVTGLGNDDVLSDELLDAVRDLGK